MDAPLPAKGMRAAEDADKQTGPILAADGTPLKRSLARALRRQKLRALGLIAPLLLFIPRAPRGSSADRVPEPTRLRRGQHHLDQTSGSRVAVASSSTAKSVVNGVHESTVKDAVAAITAPSTRHS